MRDGQSLTLVGAQTNTGNCRAELWRLVGPNEGTADIVITFSISTRAVATALTLVDVYGPTPFDTYLGATGLSQDATLTYTNGSSGDLAVVVVAKLDSTEPDLTPGTATVQEGEDVTADGTAALNVVHFMGTEPIAAPSQVVNATWATTDREWALVVASANAMAAISTSFQWKGPNNCQLQGFATEMEFDGIYTIPMAVFQGFYGNGGIELDSDGVISGNDDIRLLKQ